MTNHCERSHRDVLCRARQCRRSHQTIGLIGPVLYDLGEQQANVFALLPAPIGFLPD